MMSKKIRITEVGPRDGLQNESQPIAVKDRVRWIRALAESGVDEIEVGAFVSPKWVPQMQDSDQVFSLVKDLADRVQLTCLVPNERGLIDALAVGVRHVAIFGAASESFSQKNINCSIDESLRRFDLVVKTARQNGVSVRGYISTAFVCPYDGEIPVAQVHEVFAKFLQMGLRDISLGDTVGKANPNQVARLLEKIMPIAKEHEVDLALHFHDTYGMALANIYESLRWDVHHFDSSAGGLGGCPYAKGASGNVATEDVLYFLQCMGFVPAKAKQWDLTTLIAATRELLQKLDKTPMSKVMLAYPV